jgi:hypothetical protein
MVKQVKQWLMVNDEIYRTNENASRYNAWLCWNASHYNASLSMNAIKHNSGKIIYIATIEIADNEEQFKEFCNMADKVNGLYCVTDIMDNASKVLEKL